jgi:kinesin family protein 18/19
MIANISPSILALEDTINTLKYANRAKNIKVNLKKNIVEMDYHISKYDEIINSLKNEIDHLKQQLEVKNQPVVQISNIILFRT